MELKVKHKGNRVGFEISGIIDKQGADLLEKRFGELNVAELKEHLYNFTLDLKFRRSKSMGEILKTALDFVKRNSDESMAVNVARDLCPTCARRTGAVNLVGVMTL